MKVRDAMSRDVRVANPEESIRNAARLMAEIDVGALPVGENDRLIGVITDLKGTPGICPLPPSK